MVSNTGKVISTNYNNTGRPKELKQKGINLSTFKKRIYSGWGLYEALEIPIGQWKGEKNGS